VVRIKSLVELLCKNRAVFEKWIATFADKIILVLTQITKK
jgi:hypothetical protein